jgi:hypothetical protein
VVSVGIAVDSAAQRQAIIHLRPMFGLLEVGESQRWAHLADEPAQQLQRIVVWLPDHLKPIPGLAATAQLVRVDRDAGPEQPLQIREVSMSSTAQRCLQTAVVGVVLAAAASLSTWLRVVAGSARRSARVGLCRRRVGSTG